jgi:hypothetical protein
VGVPVGVPVAVGVVILVVVLVVVLVGIAVGLTSLYLHRVPPGNLLNFAPDMRDPLHDDDNISYR